MARYNHPPNWPKPPKGWTPPQGWKPNPKWPPAPSGWQFWIDEPKPASSAAAAPVTPAAAALAPAAAVAPAYRGSRRKSPFGAITGAVSAALLARGHRVRSTLVFSAVCIVLLAVIAVIVVGVPKKSTNVGKVTSGALPTGQARPASAGTGSAKPSASAPTSQPPVSPTAAVTPSATTATTPLSAAPLVATSASAIPTPTPTPTPTSTPTPTPNKPAPPVPTTCVASVSDATPHHDEVVNVIVATAPGAHVSVTAHYHTERTTHHAVADATGQASVPFDVLDAIYGFNVRVTVVASGAGGTLDCATSYTPSP